MKTWLLIALVACGGNGGSTPDPDTLPPPPPDGPLPDLPPPRETVTKTYSLAVGELAEAQMTGGAADRAVLRLSAPVAGIDWNIHSHPNGTTINVVVQEGVMESTYDFVPTEEADWYLLVRNGGPANMDIQVVADLYGAMTYDDL